MTIYSEQNKVTYISDGQSYLFTVPFNFVDDNISVVINQKMMEKDTDYTINKTSKNSNGEVYIKTSLNKGDKIIITRNTKLTQEVTFLEGENFPASDFELSLDKIVMSLQDLKESINNCLSVDNNSELSKEDIFDFLELANENFQTILKFEDSINKFKELENRLTNKVGPFSVLTANIKDDTTYLEYPYCLDVEIPNATKTHTSTVVLNLKDATSGIIAPISECFDGYVRIYLNTIPSSDTLEIPIILLQ